VHRKFYDIMCHPELLFYEGQQEISESSLGHKMNFKTKEKVLDLWASNQIVQLGYPSPDFKSKYL